jgi:NAD(P)-dependent dehydrogenase (short-subunit alcohol dehydrogenase family)
MANLFVEQGSIVTVVDVVASRVDEVVGQISRSGRRATGMVRDLWGKSEPEAMIDEVVKKQGTIDILCNNAGIMDAAKPVAETDDDLWDRVLNVNLNAAFRASRRVIPVMIDNGGGVILNTASVAGLFGGRAGAAYTVSKHGLIGLTRSIAASYAGKGIRCNAMVLGAVKTAIGLGGEPSPLGLENLNKAMATMPRMAEPTEIARLALFLVSDGSSFVNGSCVTIDGGWTAF